MNRRFWAVCLAVFAFINGARANWAVGISQQPSTNEVVGSQLDGMLSITNDPGTNALSISIITLHGASIGVNNFSADAVLPFIVAPGTSNQVPFHVRLTGAPGSTTNNVIVFVTGQLGEAVSENKLATTQNLTSREAVTATLKVGDDSAPLFTGNASTVNQANQIQYRLTFTNASDTPAQLVGLPAGLTAPVGTSESSRSDGPTTVPPNGTSSWVLTVNVDDTVVNGATIVQAPTANYSITNIALASRPVLISPTNFTSTVRFASLAIDRLSTTSVRLRWPTNATGFILQSNTNLATATWSNVTTTPSLLSTNYVVTNTFTGGQKYYRLKF